MRSEIDELLDAGIAAMPLIADPKRWINRRVETIEMLSHEETRRRVSVDFTLDFELRRALTIADGVVLPISVLTKEARRNFDLRDEGGRSVPVLGKAQNGTLAHIAVLHAAMQAAGDVSEDDLASIARELREIVFAGRSDAERALGAFAGRAQREPAWNAVWADETCRALLSSLWSNYVLFGVADPASCADRRILKYSYGDGPVTREGDSLARHPSRARLRRWVASPDRQDFLVECPGAWRAASFHAEVVIPEELRFERAEIRDLETARTISAVEFNVDRAALYADEEIGSDADVALDLAIAPERAGRLFQAAVTSVVVSTLLWLGVSSGLDAENPGASVSLLLAGAALFSGISASLGEHRLVGAVFNATRRWLGIVTICALMASASLAMEVPSARPTCVWTVAAVVCALAAARLCWAAVRARGYSGRTV